MTIANYYPITPDSFRISTITALTRISPIAIMNTQMKNFSVDLIPKEFANFKFSRPNVKLNSLQYLYINHTVNILLRISLSSNKVNYE